MTQFFCKKCGKSAATLEHKYCTTCGTAYNYSTFKTATVPNDHPIYQGVLILREQFSDYYNNNTTTKYKYFDDLFSKGATQVIFRFRDLIIDLVNKDFEENQKIKQIIESSMDYLKSLYINIIMDGYFVWVAENKSKSNRIGKPIAPYSESFVDECFHIKNLIYPDVIDVLIKSRDGKYISHEIARIFLTLSIFQGYNYFSEPKELKPLEQIYDNIQKNFAEAIVGGYAIALVDAKYRK